MDEKYTEPTMRAKIIRIYAHKSVTALCTTACTRHNATQLQRAYNNSKGAEKWQRNTNDDNE